MGELTSMAEQEEAERQRKREVALQDLSDIQEDLLAQNKEPAPQPATQIWPMSPPAGCAAQFATTRTPELREVATLAYRALEDAYRVISTIDGDDTHEQWELDALAKRVKDVAASLFVTLRNTEQIALDRSRAA